ncbi:GMC oxidoreductase [Gloeothece verrucosa]|uniref:GMC oxidoreductase n=1 Tax=Gloeothece verrucosa (strain PCC 7822) TaxID=497965 RepID=E0UB50_GLOV7|nr:GMC family oxidoreductase [Gloeothece verrucosa]ADN16295.1 GMC oxidoreductase [Gloeothece verrucosa PCC 7822]
MIIDDQHYDVIIVGTGAGGGTLAQKLAPTGKKILILERGDLSPHENERWNAMDMVAKSDLPSADEEWFDSSGDRFRPHINYWVGGSTKFYGAALLRMRERDFEKVQHQDGVSPEWPLKYQDFEPYYTEAEKLYNVHGKGGEDPTDPPRTQEYPHQPVTHEPRMQEICEAISKQGLHPFHLPLGIKQNNRHNFFESPNIEGDTTVLNRADVKTNSEEVGVLPALKYANVSLKTKAKVVCLHTNSSGREVKAVEAEICGQSYLFFADIVVLACGAVNSAALLLRSASEKHPIGLANRSDQVGRNFMKHLNTVMVQFSSAPNKSVFQKTICVNDFYWGDKDFSSPMGHIQNTGNIVQDMLPTEAMPILSLLVKLMPGFGLRQLANHSIGWWLQTEDLPDPNNRVQLVGDKLRLDYTPNNTEAHDRLIHRWMDVLKAIDRSSDNSLFPWGVYPRSETPIQVVAYQCGTCRFGEDPTTSVLDINCRAHDVDNLYIVDGSFFPSSAGVTPALTIIANALRVGDHLIERLK